MSDDIATVKLYTIYRMLYGSLQCKFHDTPACRRIDVITVIGGGGAATCEPRCG
jgi:hypothetical protein